MPSFRFLQAAEYDAHGGPETEDKKEKKTPTRAGRYVVCSISKHISYGQYGFFSGVPWGTPLRLSLGKLQLQVNGTWTNFTSYGSFKKYAGSDANEKTIIATLQEQYTQYKNSIADKSLLTDAEQKATLPATWIFSDFGHITIKYFKDLDGNYKMNGKETPMSDFIHTTPYDEFSTAHQQPFDLGPSHGCIHIRPEDIDSFITLGYARPGNVIEVHPYTQTIADISMERPTGKPPFEIHFYPGVKRKSRTGGADLMGKIIVYAVTPQN